MAWEGVELDESESIFGEKCLKITFGTGNPFWVPYESPPDLPTISLHKNFYLVDSFETYTTDGHIINPGLWYFNTPRTEMIKTIPFGQRDFSKFNVLSFYAKLISTSTTVRINCFLKDENKVCSETSKVETPLSDKWTRFDILLDYGNSDSSRISSIILQIWGTNTGDILYLDEIYMLDVRAVSQFGQWIPISGIEFDSENRADISNQKIAGNFGDSVYISQLNNETGEMKIITNASYHDEETCFIEYLKKTLGGGYLRYGLEGRKIYILNTKNTLKEVAKGNRKIVEVSFTSG